MIILKIIEKGHFIEIPGMPPFRTPVEANISNISIPLVVARLQTQGIKEFEIVSDSVGKAKILNQNDFKNEKNPKKKKQDNYEKRFNQLETMMATLLKKKVSEPDSDSEQITNKLSSIEKLLQKKTTVTKSKGKKKLINKEPVVEELDETFIPSIDIDSLEVKGKASQKTVKQDKVDIDDSADLLSRIMQSEE